VGERRLLPRADEPPTLCAPWRDVDVEAPRRLVPPAGHFFLLGPRGTGKSTWLRQIAAKLREQGKAVVACSTTHVATANLEDSEAMTLARFVRRYGRGVKMRLDVLILDEYSCVNTLTWCFLATVVAFSRCSVIAAGDWAQLGPVRDLRNTLECPSMRGRAFFRELCGHTRLRLHICRRSDPRLFGFYSQLSDSQEDVQVWVARAREAFPPIEGPSPINLVCSHRHRVALNARLQEHYRPPDVQAYWAEPGHCRAQNTTPQGMWLYLGLQV